MTSTSTTGRPVRVEAQLKIFPLIYPAKNFLSSDYGEAYNAYFGAFLANIEAFIGETAGLHATDGSAEVGPVAAGAEIFLKFEVQPDSDVASALRARDLVPSEEYEGYDEDAEDEADRVLNNAVDAHLASVARAAGRLFKISCVDANELR